MYIAYTRVSTDLQDSENQLFEIQNYCAAKGITIDKTITETISSKKKLKNRAISKVLSELKSGDTLIVTEISRIAREMYELMTILGSLLGKGVMVYSTKQNWTLGDNLISKVQAMGFALSADLERRLISQRTIEGLARVKANGQRLGRPEGSFAKKTKLTDHIEAIKGYVENGVSFSAIARIFGVHRLTVSSFVEKYDLDEKKMWRRDAKALPLAPEALAQRAENIAKITAAAKERAALAAEKKRAIAAKSDMDRMVSAAIQEDSLQSSISKGAKLWAYIRVSCDTQTNENQQRQINQKVATHDWQIYKWCEEVISSRVPIEQRAIMQFAQEINPNDVLIVSEISRLGRSQGEVLRVFELLLAKNVKVFSIRENYCFSDNPESRTIIGCIAMAANIERQLISQRTISALALKKANGVILGRPKGKPNKTTTKTAQRKIWEERRNEAIACMLTFTPLVEIAKKIGLTDTVIVSYCKQDYGMNYFQKCQQLTGFNTRAEYILNTNIDFIEASYKKNVNKPILLKKLRISENKGFEDFCVKTFGSTYTDLKANYHKQKKQKAEQRAKKAKAALPKQPRLYRRYNQNLENEALLRVLSQAASPDTIANIWNCTEVAVREAQQKFGISSEEYKNNIAVTGKNNTKKAS